MVKRFVDSVGLLLIFLAGGIAVQARQNDVPELGVAPATMPTSSSMAAAPVWIVDSSDFGTNRLVALDPESGARVADVATLSYNAISSSDGR